jgi:hypothetical protein
MEARQDLVQRQAWLLLKRCKVGKYQLGLVGVSGGSVKTVTEFHILLGTRNFRVSLAGVHFLRTPLHGAYPFS